MAIDVGNLVKSFKAASTATNLKGRQAFKNFIKDNDAKGFSTVNYEAKMLNPDTPAEIRASSAPARESDFLVVPGAPNGEHYVLPNFQAYNDNYHVERGLGDVFKSNFVSGKTYDMKEVSNIIPGRGIINNDGTLKITQRGSIDFGNEGPVKRQLDDPRHSKGSPDRGPEEAGNSVTEPPKVTPQPSQPVPDKTVTAPEPKPVDPVPETGKPVAAQEEPVAVPKEESVAASEPKPVDPVSKTGEPVTDSKRQAEESEQLSQKLSNIGDNSIEIEEARAEAKKAKEISDNFQREQSDVLAEDYRSLHGADDVVPNTAPKGADTIAAANVNQQELSQKYADDYYNRRKQIQKSLETGSGKNIQESAQESANKAAAADTSGGPVDMTIDRAMLRQKMGGDKTTWGRKDAEDYQLDNVIKKLEDQQLAIAQNKKLTSEQRLAEWNKHKKEAEDILAEGPGFGDYFFGNKLHYGIGGAAFAAAVGSQAFGGHKSNAELYSSPF